MKSLEEIQRMMCPECGKRILDISTEASLEIEIEAKCPYCKKIVRVRYKPNKKFKFT